MKKIETINFLKENKKKDKTLILTILVLVYLLMFQAISYTKSIKSIEDEISLIESNMKTSEVKEESNKFKRSNLIDNTKEVYDLLGSSNIERICINNNKVEVQAKCDDLSIIEELKEIRKISINNIEKNKKNYLFKAVYEIGGTN